MFVVYLITNIQNHKIYVGQTGKTAEERLQYHLWSANKKDYFHHAIRKYGPEAWIVEVLDECETQEECNEREKHWILALNSYKKHQGYNSTLGGDYGAVPTEEVRQKIGAASRKRRHSPETRRKMRLAHLGPKNHLYGLPKEQQPWFGRKLTPEHKAKCSAVRKAWWMAKWKADGLSEDEIAQRIKRSGRAHRRRDQARRATQLTAHVEEVA